MIEKYSSVSEVRNFLAENGVNWNGKMFKEKALGETYLADASISEITNRCARVQILSDEFAGTSHSLQITDTRFLIWEKVGNVFGDERIMLDLSSNWRARMLASHTKEYAPVQKRFEEEQERKIAIAKSYSGKKRWVDCLHID